MNKQIQINFIEKAKNLQRQTISGVAYRGEPQMLRILSAMLAFAIAGYLYFVGVSIMNVIVSREASMASERLQSEVATLEQEYFSLAKQVTAEGAAASGMVKPVETTFVKAQGNYYAANLGQ